MSEKNKPRKKRKDPRVECEYFEDIEVTNPKTGEKTVQKVKITRYKAVTSSKGLSTKAIIDDLEEEEFSLDLEGEGED